ncbi:FAD:protein FMN transferase [Pseudoponticoccus marisrubri]|uniref:FAD:protein FMN transferase n=1 Tax=Pseudoponticoccus marisrubri TaxID=1685382 RepID=A0A0W7WKM1_9RHOB|nr:FAD:protein FMN transferase [Pseudoponticoccus marisrubri]KUF11131.1 hypothetical protein AVJ23_08735 [Pseudoponticoccus marisrubri]
MRDLPLSLSRRRALGLAGAAALCPKAALAEGLEHLSGRAFGTSWQIVAPRGAGLARLRPGITALFDAIDAEMSPWRADSTLSRFNAAPVGTHATGPGLRAVTEAALQIARASDGAFDPTVGPLVARWGFGPIPGAGAGDWRALHVAPGGLAKGEGAGTLDLCGIAKGHALDRAVELAAAAGVTSALFDLGGELKTLGHHPSGRDWRVAVDTPAGAARMALRLPPGRAVATSGQAAQGYVLNGVLYSHIIDPAAGQPARSALHGVTVTGPDAMVADGWATALFAAGADRGTALARSLGLAALFVPADPARAPVATGAMKEVLL